MKRRHITTPSKHTLLILQHDLQDTHALFLIWQRYMETLGHPSQNRLVNVVVAIGRPQHHDAIIGGRAKAVPEAGVMVNYRSFRFHHENTAIRFNLLPHELGLHHARHLMIRG